MNFNYDEATRRQCAQSADVFPSELSPEKIIQLLLYLEGEVETRDQIIESLKEEKAKLILFEAKYARVCPADPIHALARDSNIVPDIQLQTSIGELFDCQVNALERICNSQSESHRRTLHIAHSAEHRLDLALKNLEIEINWKNKAVSYEVMQAVKSENDQLKEEMERNKKTLAHLKKEMEETESKRQTDNERHKNIILYMMNERKELFATMSEIQILNNTGSNKFEQKALIDEMRKHIESLIDERDTLKNANKSMKCEIVALKESAKTFEDDLILKKTTVDDGSVVMSNRIAMNAPSKNLSSSSSFPSDKSRLPRAPGSSPTNASLSSKTLIAKKTPAMGVSTMRRTVERRVDGEGASKLSRSSSLRGQSEPRPVGHPISSIRPSTLPKSPCNGANVSPISTPSSMQSATLSRLPYKSDVKITKTKSSLLRAFGK
ncbi:hypothetical protein PMAYCL1PPCAC_18156 [Pristionchus mayeri]|uniref:Cortactin-binding protein-2 N-terminal domain-containing protein n=1 Tax=Pristionchus mayeri TaxID=1317129 RepID=A0AAN5CNW6_9BILA|nr:hypothetical protein PMAYCL1PPCAC_18156 [Pristionchus mayeri]